MSGPVDLAVLLGAAVVLVAVLAVRVSDRFGLPTLLIYLGLGLALGEAGLGVHFDNASLTRTLGLSALVLILAEGGLSTRWPTVRRAMVPGVVLATIGFGISVAVTAGAAILILGFDARDGLLLGAIVSSTDAAAVFATLRRLPLRGRLAAILEVESGVNDAPAVILVVVLSAAHGRSVAGTAAAHRLRADRGSGDRSGRGRRRCRGPAAQRAAVRRALPARDRRVRGPRVRRRLGGPRVRLSGGLSRRAGARQATLPHRRATLGFAEGLGSLAQIGLFVLLGLLVSPDDLPSAILPGLAVGAVLLVFARPLAVFFSVVWFRLRLREHLFLSWAGLRGAVPIVLATIPISAGRPHADALFNTVVVLVIVFTLIQGTSLPWVAVHLDVLEPAAPREVTVEAAPLEELGADLLQVQVPVGSRLHGVYVDELRLPTGAALSLVVQIRGEFRAGWADPTGSWGLAAHRGDVGGPPGDRAAAACGEPGRPAGPVVG